MPDFPFPLNFELYFLKKSDFPVWVSEVALIALEHSVSTWLRHKDGDLLEYLAKAKPTSSDNIEKKCSRYYRLFQSTQMKYCWKKASSLTPGDSGQFLFSLMLWHSLPHIRAKTVTKTESEEWKGQLLGALIKARDKAYDTPDNMLGWLPLQRDSFDELVRGENPQLNEQRKCRLISPYPHTLLQMLIDSLQSTKYDPKYYGKHIHSATGDRQHFVRHLTALLIHYTGSPNRRMVADSASVAFDCNFEERDVIKATKDLPDDNHSMFESIYQSYLMELH